ncbi:MAG TPA: HAD-IIB family hydrolase [Candidatus Paceibacterota bacterium]|nr:HAD-IIB family hydrolase [Candidatus Paceibacterota bacterium]
MECPKAVVFDLDETLAESFKPPTSEMIGRLKRLLELFPVGVITGRTFSWVEPGFLPFMTDSPHIDRFYVFPESSAQCLQWDGSVWKELYSFTVGEEERVRIRAAIAESVAETKVLEGLPRFGEQYLNKNGMVSFACLGYEVPADMKYTWDPGNERRKILKAAVAEKLPDLEVSLGGATTIDVTEKGQNKSRGINWFAEHLRIPAPDMLYIGDALYEGGNDFVVIGTGIETRETKDPQETLAITDEILAACANN